jgi:hypothetical protein
MFCFMDPPIPILFGFGNKKKIQLQKLDVQSVQVLKLPNKVESKKPQRGCVLKFKCLLIQNSSSIAKDYF